jgi:hypothetical protein
MIIPTVNNLTVNSPKTYLSNSLSVGTNVLNVKNLNGFGASWAIQLGDTGEAQAEIVLLSSSTPVGTLGTISGTCVYDHPADTPVYAIKFDQIVFERSTTGTAGAAVPMTNGTVGIQCNSQTTVFDDTTGLSTYAYKTYFRNSALPLSSTESDWITSSGFSFYSLGKLRQRVKDKLVNSSYMPDETIINDWLNEWLEMMTNTAIDVNEDYSLGTTSIVYTGTAELGTITDTDFKQPRRIYYCDSSGSFTATKMDVNSFSPNKTFTNTYPYYYFQGDNIIGRKPSDSTGTLQIVYYKNTPVMVNDTDELPLSMRAYTKSFVDYGHAQALFKDSKSDEATLKLQEASSMLQRYKTELTPRGKTGVTYVDIVEDTGADQELWL